MPHLILASGSPRRRQFLQELGLQFTVMVADIDETPHSDEAPQALAQRLATSKARAVAGRLGASQEHSLIIAADTVVALGDQLLGKPVDAQDAVAMLVQLRNQEHFVHSAVSVFDMETKKQQTRLNSTRMQMRNYSDAEITAYVDTGDPLDKAGAYAIQHREFDPVWALEGCMSGVIGLPLGDLVALLAEFGMQLPCTVATICRTQSNFVCCQT